MFIKQKIKQHINRKAPYAILSWRYLLPGQNAAIRLHKAVLLHAWADKPRIVWFFITLFSYIKWFAFQGWIQLWKTWKKMSPVLQEKRGISRYKQFNDLLKLVFLQTTPPHFYYHYRLYRYTKLEWFNFIYTHELPNWHRVMSPYLSSRTTNLLSDKDAFAWEMKEQGLPVIDGIVINRENQLTQKQLFHQKSLFLKPLCGNQKIGAYELKYNAFAESYTLTIAEYQTINDKEEIFSFLKPLTEARNYLIQPLLLNHPDLQNLSDYHSLITFRVITVWAENKALILSAIAEFPICDSSDYYYMFPVDLKSGIILAVKEKSVTVKKEIESKFEHIPGHQVILWQEMMAIAQKAHAFFPDLFSIGWDLAVTPEGVKLIEGNINWAVNAHQMDAPILMPAYISYARPDILKNKNDQRI